MGILFFVELIFLFFLSKITTSQLSLLFQKIFKSKKVVVFLLAFIFLPGTIIHELSHAVMAGILFVRVGKMELVPQISDNSLKLGSVEVGKTDIIRNFLIGIAPFVTGTLILLALLYYVFSNNLIGINLTTFLVLIFVFIVSNTMYSSKKDMEGAIEFLILVLTPVAFLYLLGVRIPFSQLDFESYFRGASFLMLVPIIVDLTIIILAKLLNK